MVDTTIHIGKRIALIRTMRGLTQEQLAPLVPTSRSNLNDIEARESLDHALFLKILLALDISYDRFMNLNIDKIIAGEPEENYLTELEALKRENVELKNSNVFLKSIIEAQNKAIDKKFEK